MIASASSTEVVSRIMGIEIFEFGEWREVSIEDMWASLSVDASFPRVLLRDSARLWLAGSV